MVKSGNSFLFGNYRIVNARSGQSEYAHTFGGPPDRAGTARADCNGLLIHLLHRLDLTDPMILISVPSLRWLPIYYCFDFRANELGYQLLSDAALVTFFPNDPNVATKESWPDKKGYPLEFPKSTITLEAYAYDPTNLEDAYRWAGVFGIGKLTPHDQILAKKQAVYVANLLGCAIPESEEEFADALFSPFIQGKPNSSCLNPHCPNHKHTGQLTPIALLPAEPVVGVHTFGRSESDVELIVQMCPLCYTIRVSNQCD